MEIIIKIMGGMERDDIILKFRVKVRLTLKYNSYKEFESLNRNYMV